MRLILVNGNLDYIKTHTDKNVIELKTLKEIKVSDKYWTDNNLIVIPLGDKRIESALLKKLETEEGNCILLANNLNIPQTILSRCTVKTLPATISKKYVDDIIKNRHIPYTGNKELFINLEERLLELGEIDLLLITSKMNRDLDLKTLNFDLFTKEWNLKCGTRK